MIHRSNGNSSWTFHVPKACSTMYCFLYPQITASGVHSSRLVNNIVNPRVVSCAFLAFSSIETFRIMFPSVPRTSVIITSARGLLPIMDFSFFSTVSFLDNIVTFKRSLKYSLISRTFFFKVFAKFNGVFLLFQRIEDNVKNLILSVYLLSRLIVFDRLFVSGNTVLVNLSRDVWRSSLCVEFFLEAIKPNPI